MAKKKDTPENSPAPKLPKGFAVLDSNGTRVRVVETEQEALEVAKVFSGRVVRL